MSRIFRTIRTWRGGGLYAGLLGGILALAMAPAHTSAQSVEDKYQQLRDRKSLFNLAAKPDVFLSVNKLQCGATSEGETCVDTFGSPTGGGGFFPAGTSDQYVFSSGLQVAGIITAGPGCDKTTRNKVAPTAACFAWSGDTTAALFFEGSGNLHHGTPITAIYNSLDPADLAIWPTPGSVPDFPEATSMIINDTSLFNDVLIGRKAASQQDSWVAYWDGDPGKSGGRTHPMGILAEQRTLAWNYPDGNEATMYLIYRLTNVTNNALFQQTNETKYFGGLDSLPNTGWTFDSVFVAYAADPDVCAGGGNNQGSGIMPFSMAITYHTGFSCTGFVFPPEVYHAPFAKAPGVVGFKFLRSPNDPKTGQQLGLTALSLNTNGGAFPDANSVAKAWRYVSLNVDPSKGDGTCSYPVTQIKAKRACYLGQTKADVRIYEASGPMSLAPGQSATIAASIIAAAPVATPLITIGPSADNPPGIPSLAPGCFGTTPRPIEITSGWLTSGTCPADTLGVMDQKTVKVVPGSLLGKALVAQSIFDNKFLLGFAPEPPDFYLVPGDNQVTVIWDASRTETLGDPFFVAAGNPASALFDPNYRKFDVEGYRIYRGNTAGQLSLIAQFDKTGSTFTDKTCSLDATHVTGTACAATTTYDINGDFVQYSTVAQLASGDPLVPGGGADTALAAQIHAGTAQPLSNTGIPFAFVDTQVRNGFTYFYKVTAFDINSLKSAPSSLESAGPTKSVIPRVASAALSAADFGLALTGRGKVLDPTAPVPAIDPVKGTFAGPMPPTNGLAGSFSAYATQLLAAGAKSITIDSIRSGYYPNGTVAFYHLTVDGVRTDVNFTNSSVSTGAGDPQTVALPVVSFLADPSIRATLKSQGVDAPALAGSMVSTLTFDRPHWGSQNADWAGKQPGFWSIDPPTTAYGGGSRWFSGANETMADPTINISAHGQLDGVTKIFEPVPYANTAGSATASGSPFLDPTIVLASYKGTTGATVVGDIMRRLYGSTFGVTRAADVKIYWGAGKVDSVIDVTHNTVVPQVRGIEAGYGFLTDSDGDGKLTYGDFYYLPGLEATGDIGPFATAKPSPLAAQPVVMTTDINGDLVADANGFGLYINGEPFLFQAAVPTNTVWTLRTYQGSVTKSAAGVYSFASLPRNPAVPGLTLKATVVAPAQIVAANADLTKVHTVPDPYYGASLFDLGPANKELQFVNLPPIATIRIYSTSGVLVDVVNHNDPTGGGTAKWDLRNRSNQFVASGVYMFHVSTPEGKSAIGKFTVVNSGLGQ